MLSRVLSGAVRGIDGYLVDVETDLSAGLPSFATVGLPFGAVKEGRERVSAALQNAGFVFPLARVTVNLAPADQRKEGSAFDLPIALGILAASEQASIAERLAGIVVVGELGLDGAVRPVRGVLPIAMAAAVARCRAIVVPLANVPEAAVVDSLDVFGAATLGAVVEHLSGRSPLTAASPETAGGLAHDGPADVDLAEVRGQEHARRALEIAAAGAHNLIMVGPPGAGKTMLARRLPGILPPLSLAEALETTRIHSVAGTLRPGQSLMQQRPFRAPHHTVSDAGLIGGGGGPRPGEASLAHNGVLFLDELPEFRANVLEALRQPLEDGTVQLARAAATLSFPARCMLAAAMNPCPCGYLGDAGRRCTCRESAVGQYLAKVSGPLLDRIDIHLEVPAVKAHELADHRYGEPSAAVRLRVLSARRIQQERFAKRRGVFANAHMGPRDLRSCCRLTDAADALLRTAIARLRLSARGYHRTLKIARTIADLAGAAAIAPEHVSEAVQYRVLDRLGRIQY